MLPSFPFEVLCFVSSICHLRGTSAVITAGGRLGCRALRGVGGLRLSLSPRLANCEASKQPASGSGRCTTRLRLAADSSKAPRTRASPSWAWFYVCEYSCDALLVIFPLAPGKSGPRPKDLRVPCPAVPCPKCREPSGNCHVAVLKFKRIGPFHLILYLCKLKIKGLFAVDLRDLAD